MGVNNGQAASRLPRILVVSYKGLTRLVQSVSRDFHGLAQINIVDVVFDEAIATARDAASSNSTDIIVSAGANADLLRSNLKLPVVTIRTTGYDVLQALLKARQFSERVGVVTYAEKIPQLDAVKDLLRLTLSQQTYLTIDDARDCFHALTAEGYNVIVGSSLVVDLAEASGLKGILTYSATSVRTALEDALEIVRVRKLEAERYAPIHAVLEHLHEAVLAVDVYERVIAINPAMENLLSVSRERALGTPLKSLGLGLDLADTLASGKPERGLATRVRGVECIADRAPTFDGNQVVGALLTLQDAQAIQRADSSLRSHRRQHSLTAKYHFEQILGHSNRLQELRDTAHHYAQTPSTILITGESGTGKELFAQAIHNASPRRTGPFVAINCASFPESLLESELFGHEEGAFTGSRKGGKSGLFEAAHRGTIFLDEIGDMPISLQTRLLRVLQEKEIVRLGSTQPVPIDVRFVAATHQDLHALIERGAFRNDLYFRLNILRLQVPPLRERPDDIQTIATDLLDKALQRQGAKVSAKSLLEPLLGMLVSYHWPGNVRELENVIERIAVRGGALKDGSNPSLSDFASELSGLVMAPEDATKMRTLDDPDSSLQAMRALAEAGGNHMKAARMLGISRTTLWRRLRAASI